MISTLLTHILIERLKTENVSFDFSIDFQGQTEYIESEDTEQFLDYEVILQHFVHVVGGIPINERTEGTLLCKNGVVQIWYNTCTQVGEDWDSDNWVSGKYKEVL
jgi:hypothetical protein